MPNDNLADMVIEAQTLGFKPGEWPETFTYQDRTWTKGEALKAGNGDVQYVEYTDGETWLIVYPG